jgi:Zn-dependent peptidase ImmA (M78 family)/transcriptional regulator with XRE-family HTH domain
MTAMFNGAMLRLARQRRALTQIDAARLLGVEQPLLSRVENGLASATEAVVLRAAQVYDVPREFFLLTDTIYGPPVSVHAMWRKKADVAARDLDAIVAELNVRSMHMKRFLDGVALRAKADVPRLDIEDYGGDPSRVAALLRSHWKVPSGPIANLVALVERAGIIVAHSELAGTSVSGVTFAVPGQPPVILLNSEQATDRMRFTLAHEIGHLVMHRFPSSTMEDEANLFASELLMPAPDIRPNFANRRVDLMLLGALKQEWRVSMQALLMRAASLGFISDGQKQYLFKQMSVRGLRMREPPQFDVPREEPKLIYRIADAFSSSLKYSPDDLARLLSARKREVEQMYLPMIARPPQAPKLSIVT